MYFCLFLFFVYLLPSLTNKRLHTTSLVLDDGAIENILRAKIWLDVFDSVFWHISIEFLFVVFFVVLFSRLIKWIWTGPNALWDDLLDF